MGGGDLEAQPRLALGHHGEAEAGDEYAFLQQPLGGGDGPGRAIADLAVFGVHDVVAKSLGSANPYNMIRATFAALQSLNTPRMVAARRGKKVSDILGPRDIGGGGEESGN